MSRSITPLFVAAALIAGLASTAKASPAAALQNANPVTADTVQLSHSYNGRGHAKLHKVLKSHFYRIPITRDIRAAAGDPDMAVLDNRAGHGPFRCSFITYRGHRAMTCD